MEIKNKINEENFNLEIYKWDDFTLDLLKSYSDWKTYNMKTEGSKDFTPPLFSNDEILCNESEYGSINLYKPVLKHVLDNTGVHFFKTEGVAQETQDVVDCAPDTIITINKKGCYESIHEYRIGSR